jgi:hypothetical protein
MSRREWSRIAIAALCAAACAAPTLAAASPQAPDRGPAQAAAGQPGPLVLQPIESGFVFTPEMRLTRIDRFSATQLGGYAGWLVSDAILVGAGGYGLVSGPGGFGLSYGGVMAGITLPAGDRLRLGVRGLLGFGEARVTEHLPVMCPYPSVDFAPCYQSYRIHRHVAVFEPQVTLGARLGPKTTFELSGGYRIVSDAGGWGDRFQSGFGSVGVRFGPF